MTALLIPELVRRPSGPQIPCPKIERNDQKSLLNESNIFESGIFEFCTGFKKSYSKNDSNKYQETERKTD